MLHSDQVKIDFDDSQKVEVDFRLFEDIITDRGSRYSVAVGKVGDRKACQQFLKKLKQDKRYAKATHNSWAARVSRNGQIFETKNDDGETGAGMVILRILQKQNFTNAIVVVTRWFGGVKLQGDRFRHVQDATKYGLQNSQ